MEEYLKSINVDSRINILRSDVDLMVNRRILIVLEEGAEAKFLFCDHSADSTNFRPIQ